MRMVLGTGRPKQIGERVVGCTDHTGQWHWEQPIVVLREVDRQAWVAYNASMGNPHPRSGDGESWFYEVSMD